MNCRHSSRIVWWWNWWYGLGRGAAGLLRSRMLASAGVRPALRWLQGMHALTIFSHSWPPPRDRGSICGRG